MNCSSLASFPDVTLPKRRWIASSCSQSRSCDSDGIDTLPISNTNLSIGNARASLPQDSFENEIDDFSFLPDFRISSSKIGLIISQRRLRIEFTCALTAGTCWTIPDIKVVVVIIIVIVIVIVIANLINSYYYIYILCCILYQ